MRRDTKGFRFKFINREQTFTHLVFRGKEVPNYFIGNYGSVKYMDKYGYIVYRNSYIDTDGYERITLLGSSIKVHRLVTEAYIPNPENKKTVNHKDGKKLNNYVGNLEWNTQKENVRHATYTGLRTGFLTDVKIVKEICELLEKGMKPKEVSKIKNITLNTVERIAYKYTWTEISKKYNLPDSYAEFKFSDDDIHSICKMLESGKSNKFIQSKYDISTSMIRSLMAGKTRKDITSQYKLNRHRGGKYNRPEMDKILHNLAKDILENCHKDLKGLAMKYQLPITAVRDFNIGRMRGDISVQYWVTKFNKKYIK